ncbi:MAG TPA: histidine kinase [Casimicrobiaceae bacterium]|nr:histidine kinase [Casimicrobiaceae bacterium]
MTSSVTTPAAQRLSWRGLLCAGTSWQIVALIFAINTGYAGMMSIEDTRPFWHPFITAQCLGLSIAYFVSLAAPWYKTRPVLRLALAVALGTVVGYGLIFAVKGAIIGEPGYGLADMFSAAHKSWTLLTGFGNGLFVSLFFLIQFREARSRAELLRAEADRNLLSKQAIEAELKLMQAQVEPHFLFNTLASVQFLAETDPPKASLMLGHLIAYLRAALPQLRSNSSTLGQESELARAYLSIMQMRMGARLCFAIDVPEALRSHRFPPMLLMSLVENAIIHGVEPQAAGGTVRLEAHREANRLSVSVADDGRGLGGGIGNGVGLSNLRGRLAALYADQARFRLEELTPHGARATVELPYEPA